MTARKAAERAQELANFIALRLPESRELYRGDRGELAKVVAKILNAVEYEAATIEQCAQIADKMEKESFDESYETAYRKIGAAIRAMKGE